MFPSCDSNPDRKPRDFVALRVPWRPAGAKSRSSASPLDFTRDKLRISSDLPGKCWYRSPTKNPGDDPRVFYVRPGDDLLSHSANRAVASALRGLTTVFGMGTGVTPAVWSPGNSKLKRAALRGFPPRRALGSAGPLRCPTSLQKSLSEGGLDVGAEAPTRPGKRKCVGQRAVDPVAGPRGRVGGVRGWVS